MHFRIHDVTQFLVFATCSVCWLGSMAFADTKVIETTAPIRPNIVVFFIDDLGYADLGCYGSTFYETPHIDALAASGVRMTNFYSANPVCSPTRAAMMTGKAPQRLGITQWLSQPNEKGLAAEETTIAEALQNSGYQTGFLGKWHLGDRPEFHPSMHGFKFTSGVNRAGQPGSYYFPFKRKKKRNATEDYWSVPDFEDGNEGDYLTDRLTDRAIEFIKQSAGVRNADNNPPFFLMLSHYAVHTPIQPPTTLLKKYEGKRESQFGASETPKINHLFDSHSRGRQDNPGYAGMVENLDTNIGRVMEKLEHLNLLDNTIVVFTSDNGGLSTVGNNRTGPTCCLPLRAGKGWTYEGGIRIPTIFYWKGKFKAAECSAPGITMDVYPTLLELAGLPANPEQCLDGLSLAKVVTDPSTADANRFLGWTYPHDHGSMHRPSQAARMGDWKLVRHIDDLIKDEDRIELYNLATDPGEKENVAAGHQEIVKEMETRLDEWLKETTPVQATN